MPKPTQRNPYPFAQTIGPVVREARKQRFPSDKQFAKASGISRRHLVEFQKGANVTILTAFRAMKALGLKSLSHEFEGETLTLNVRDTPATIDAGALIAVAERIEQAVGLLAQAAAVIRSAAAHGGEQAAAPSHKDSSAVAGKAAAMVEEFGKLFNQLDSDGKVEVLHLIAKEASASTRPPSAEAPPAPKHRQQTRKRRAL